MKVLSEYLSDLWQGLVSRNVAKSASICEIQSFEEYESGYRQLARLLGRAGKIPPSGEAELIRTLLGRRRQYTGSLTLADSLFLAAFVSILAPRRTLELGTAAGFSSALVAAIIHRRSDRSAKVCVDTIDADARYFANQELPVGCEIADLIPEFPEAVRIHAPRESDFVQSLADQNELEVVFIDANHAHPWPLLDLLRIAPYVRPSGWIVLHDIRLGTLGLKARATGASAPCPEFGAEWLFQSWPFKKISGGKETSSGNTGAIQLPRHKRAIVRTAEKLMRLPFEVCPENDRGLRRELHQCCELL